MHRLRTVQHRSTPRAQWQFSSQRPASVFQRLIEQASLRNHNDITSMQGNIPLKILAGFVSSVVEHEDRFIPTGTTPSYLDAGFGRIRTYAAGQTDRRHKCGGGPPP